MARKYSYVVEQRHTSLGQIERGLTLLGFRVTDAQAIGDPEDGELEAPTYKVHFEEGTLAGIRGSKSGATIDQIQGR